MKKFFIMAALYVLLLPGIALAADNIEDLFPAVPLNNYADSLILSQFSDRALVNGCVRYGANVKIKDGTVWLPLRFVAENLGWQVNYSNGKVKLIQSQNEVSLQVGSDRLLLNGRPQTLPAAPFIENSVLWLPLRSIGEALGKQVDWLENYQSYLPCALPYKLALIYDKGSSFPTGQNTEGVNHLYDCYLALLYDWWDVVFADKYITVYRTDDKLFLQDSYYSGAEAFALSDSAEPIYEKKQTDDLNSDCELVNELCFWRETPNGWLLRRLAGNSWDLRGRQVLYYLDNKNIQLANWRYLGEEINFAALQICNGGVLTLCHFDRDDVWDYNETNLVYYDFATGAKHSIGTPGYFYGFDLAGNQQIWQIENGKITIYGYDRRIDTPQQKKLASYMQYTFDLPE